MKKFITILFAVFALLSFSSCDTYAQDYYMYNNGIVYEYSYNSYPVRYINGIAYYYCITNGIWNWVILPRAYYPYVVQHYPRRYVHPHNGYRRPDVRHSAPNWPEIQRREGSFHRGGNNDYRPHNGINHQNIGGHSPSRGGMFGHSSSRGGRR